MKALAASCPAFIASFHAACTAPQVYCLPDNYEVIDRSLDDIRHVLQPTFTRAEVGAGKSGGAHDGCGGCEEARRGSQWQGGCDEVSRGGCATLWVHLLHCLGLYTMACS